MEAPLNEDLVRAIEHTRVTYRFDRIERMIASGLPDGRGVRTEWFGAARATDWKPMPRVFCFAYEDVERLDEVLAWYADAGREPMFEILPLDGNRVVFEALAVRGFAPRYTISVLVTRAVDADADTPRVRVSPEDEIDAWSSVYVDAHGWECTDEERPEWVAELSAQYDHPSITRYVAEVGGELAAVAASYRGEGDLGYLTNCATLPPHRGRGLHAALIRRRLADLAKDGVVHAGADTSPYSISQRNLERAGFRLAYQKTHWSRSA